MRASSMTQKSAPSEFFEQTAPDERPQDAAADLSLYRLGVLRIAFLRAQEAEDEMVSVAFYCGADSLYFHDIDATTEDHAGLV